MLTRFHGKLLLAVALAATAAARPASTAAANKAKTQAGRRVTPKRNLVGVYYFPGWQQADRWYPIMAHPAAQQPLIGFYREGEPRVAEAQIAQAAAYGVDFFAFDYYWLRGARWLEAALDEGFLRAGNLNRISFCLLWCNHREFCAFTGEELESFLRFAIEKYCGHPQYLRIDQRPVLMFLDFSQFMRELGPEAVHHCFDRAAELCSQRGLRRPFFVACADGFGGPGADTIARQLKCIGFDATTFYNYPFAGVGASMGTPGSAPYADLESTGESLWNSWKNLADLPHWPTAMVGWDPRPWHRDRAFVRTGRTPQAFRKMLERAKAFASPGEVVMLEAWNEWGEGSALEPSKQEKFAYLEQVRDVFGAGSRPVPKMPGSVPVFSESLPMLSRWGFDVDAQGWTVIRDVTDFHQEYGTLCGKTSGTDPSLLSPPTAVNSADYRSLHLRLRVSGPPDSAAKAPVQFFWNGVEYHFSESRSAVIEVAADGQFHDLNVPLQNHPDWKGRLAQLRLDIGDRPGVSFAIDLVSLEP